MTSLLWYAGSFIAVCRLLSSCGAWAPECLGPVFAACGLSCPHGMWDIGSQTRDGTHVPCIGKQILNHRTTREVPYIRDLCHISPYEVSRPRVLSPVYWKRDAHMITWPGEKLGNPFVLLPPTLVIFAPYHSAFESSQGRYPWAFCCDSSVRNSILPKYVVCY